MDEQRSKVCAVVMAAGKGTRMNSETPKVLHQIGGKPMVQYTLESLKKLNLQDILVVVGYEADQVKTALGPKWHYILQEDPKGTADALRVALGELPEDCEQVLVVGGDDSAFYSLSTLAGFISNHLRNKAPISVITTDKPEAEGVARVIRDNGYFQKILEWPDYVSSGLKSKEVNCGAYIFKVAWIKTQINRIPISSKGEYYITEALNLAVKVGQRVNTFWLFNSDEWVGVNTPEELEKANQVMRQRTAS